MTKRGAIIRCVMPAAFAAMAIGCGGKSTPNDPGGGGALSFRHVVIDPAPPGGADCCTDVCATGDLDGDGLPDLVVGGQHATGAALAWYRAPAWDKLPLGDGEFTTDMQVADLDGDNRNDIVVGDLDRGLVWLRNPDAPGGAWQQQVIGAGYVHDLEAGDIDGDGDFDLVTGDKAQVVVWMQAAGGAWQSRQVLARDGEGVALADLDGDGDLDLVLGGLWLETPAEPLTGTWTRHDFAPGWSKDARVKVGDLDGDGDLDVVLAASEGEGPLAWFTAPDEPRTEDWTEHRIGRLTLNGAHSLQLADFDGNGSLDVATAEMHIGGKRVLVYLQVAGGGWREMVLATSGSHNLRAVDVGADGDVDLVGKNFGGAVRAFEMWENLRVE